MSSLNRLSFLKLSLATWGLVFTAAGAAQAQPPENQSTPPKSASFSDKEGVANGGYDLVAYFTENRATKGRLDYAATYDNLTYLFASVQHRDQFIESPRKFLPAFGGWCAFAVAAKQKKFPPDPATFKLYNGKLLLFYNGKHGNTSVPWNQDEQNMYQAAVRNWPAVAKQPPPQ